MKYIYLPVTRKEAKELGLNYYYTGVACKNGHFSRKYTKNFYCVECHKESKRKRNRSNRHFPDGTTPRARKLEENKRTIYRSRRVVPKWSETQAIYDIYESSRQMGKHYEVDHIVPMKSYLVCGLHCLHNLKIVPKKLNRMKINAFWPNMPAYEYEDIVEILQGQGIDFN